MEVVELVEVVEEEVLHGQALAARLARDVRVGERGRPARVPQGGEVARIAAAGAERVTREVEKRVGRAADDVGHAWRRRHGAGLATALWDAQANLRVAEHDVHRRRPVLLLLVVARRVLLGSQHHDRGVGVHEPLGRAGGGSDGRGQRRHRRGPDHGRIVARRDSSESCCAAVSSRNATPANLRVDGEQRTRLIDQSGQALLLALGLAAALLTGALVLVALGEALGAKSREQRAADLAAVSAAGAMRECTRACSSRRSCRRRGRGFHRSNPRHLSRLRYLAIARAAAVRGGARNGARVRQADVTFPGGGSRPRGCGCACRPGISAGPGDPCLRMRVAAAAVAELAPVAWDRPGGGRRLQRPAGPPPGQAHAPGRRSRHSTEWRRRPPPRAST